MRPSRGPTTWWTLAPLVLLAVTSMVAALVKEFSL